MPPRWIRKVFGCKDFPADAFNECVGRIRKRLRQGRRRGAPKEEIRAERVRSMRTLRKVADAGDWQLFGKDKERGKKAA